MKELKGKHSRKNNKRTRKGKEDIKQMCEQKKKRIKNREERPEKKREASAQGLAVQNILIGLLCIVFVIFFLVS